jgi:hypothetical protein
MSRTAAPLQIGELVYYHKRTQDIGLVVELLEENQVRVRQVYGLIPSAPTGRYLWHSFADRLAQERRALDQLLARRAAALANLPAELVSAPNFEWRPSEHARYTGGQGLRPGQLVSALASRKIGLILEVNGGVRYRVLWSDGAESDAVPLELRNFDAWIGEQVRLLTWLQRLYARAARDVSVETRGR